MSKSDVDLEQFAKLFDAALASDNENVQKALRNFLFIASIVEAQNDLETKQGPFTKMLDDIACMKKEIVELRHEVRLTRGTTVKDYWYGQTYLDDQTWSKNAKSQTSTTGTFFSDVDDRLLDILKKSGSSGDV